MYVALLFEDNLQEFRFIVHEKAAEFPHVMNALQKGKEYFLIQMIGPFVQKKDAEYIQNIWEFPHVPRGILLSRGIEICKMFNLPMWVGSKEDIKHINYPPTIKSLK
jgi:hypothetical protein